MIWFPSSPTPNDEVLRGWVTGTHPLHWLTARFYILIDGGWEGDYADTLPEALRKVADCMERQPEASVVIADRTGPCVTDRPLVIDPNKYNGTASACLLPQETVS